MKGTFLLLTYIAYVLSMNINAVDDNVLQTPIVMGTVVECALAGTCVSHDYKIGSRVEDLSVSQTLRFAIKQNDAGCASEIMRISDPNSADYAEYLTREEIQELMQDKEATAAVEAWLTENSIDYTVLSDGTFIKATATLQQWETLLSATFYNFHSEITGRTIVRSQTASLPLRIAADVQFIGDCYTLPVTNRVPKIFFSEPTLSADIAEGNVSPQLIAKTYNIQNVTINNRNINTGATTSLFESLGQEYSPSDLTTFDSQFNVPAQKVAKVVGSNVPSDCQSNPNNCAEANLDVQWITSVAQFSPLTYWSIPPTGDIFLDWIDKIAAMSNPPLVHSISYGGPESENNKQVVQRFNTEVCKMGLRGLTVMVASGDDGVAGSGARGNPAGCGFNPSYPATCEYITAVGATQGPESGNPERVCASDAGGLITSGGGFSTVFNTPTWQSNDVSSYLKNGPNMPPTSQFNSKGRAYPDVADMGHNYPIVINSNTYVGSGTSASSPVFAAMVALTNDARITAGKKPLGFINPSLYKFGEASEIYNDITVGENNCAAGNQGSETCCKYGFTATTGWDPASGLGSPHFEKFKAKFMSLP